MNFVLAVLFMSGPVSKSVIAGVPPVAGAQCLRSWTPLQGNLPLGTTDRSTEVIQIWKLFVPVRSASPVFAGWVYENRNREQFVQVNTVANAAALGHYVATLPANAQIKVRGLRPFAYASIGQAGRNQQFVAALARRHMVENCFSGRLR